MALEITVATLVALGYALGAYADERRERRARRMRLGRHPFVPAQLVPGKLTRPPLPYAS